MNVKNCNHQASSNSQDKYPFDRVQAFSLKVGDKLPIEEVAEKPDYVLPSNDQAESSNQDKDPFVRVQGMPLKVGEKHPIDVIDEKPEYVLPPNDQVN